MKKQKGSIIVFALIVLSFILVAAFSVASVTLVERRSAGASVNSSTAFQNADKGMEEFLQKLYKELDQNATLQDVADELSGYSCDNSSEETVPATIGNENTEFIISAYEEVENSDDEAGWQRDSLVPITECNTALADVARFKAAGNFNNAARAVFLKLRDSLSRGLVAKWSFEDRAQIARLTSENDREKRISWFAQDSSKRGHVLTLCPIYYDTSDDPDKPEIEFLRENNDIDTLFVDEFSVCAFDDTGGMRPQRRYAENSYKHSELEPTDDEEYDALGAWDEGKVEEIIPLDDDTLGDLSREEAIYFDGSTYLAMNVESSCPENEITCVETSDDKLILDEGISVSLWVKKDDSNDTGSLISRRDGNNGYHVYAESSERVCFEISNRTHCTGSGVLDDDWHHIVALWRSGSGGNSMKIFVDGAQEGSPTPFSGSIGDSGGEPVYVGFTDGGGSADYFTGAIDDMRIWNRGLTKKEIYRLCSEGDSNHSCAEPL